MYRPGAKKKGPVQKWIDGHRRQLPYMISAFVIAVLYIGGLLAQATRIDIFNQNRAPFTWNPFKVIFLNFQNPRGLIIVLMICGGLAVWGYLKLKDMTMRDLSEDERGFQVDNSNIFGSNTLLDKEQARDFVEIEPLKMTDGIIIGKYASDDDPDSVKEVVSVPRDGKRYKHDAIGRRIFKRDEEGRKIYERERLKINGNRHMVVIGPSGSGKSYCFSRSAILQSINHEESIVVTDPKGELYADTSEYARDRGYVVKILNLANPTTSDSWDVLGEVKKNSDQLGVEVMNVCSIIIENTENPMSKTDEAYKSGEQNLLTSLVLYIMTSPTWPEDQRTLACVMDLLAKDDDALNTLFENLPEGNVAKGPWSIYFGASPAFRGNLRAGLGTRLKVLHDETIRQLTGFPDIDLTQPGESPCAYYVIMEDMTSTFKFLSSLFFSGLFNSLVLHSRKQKSGKLKHSVNFILDEFTAIGALPDFDKKLATVRSAGLNIMMIFQTLTHLEAIYPNGLWETLIANCTTMICLACNDLTTAKYLSDRSGTASVAQEQMKVSRPTMQLANVVTDVAYSYSTGKREVMTLGDVVTLAGDSVLVSVMSADLFILKKFPYTDMIDPSTLRIVNMFDHVPAWRQQKSASMVDSGSRRVNDETAPYESKRNRGDKIVPLTDEQEMDIRDTTAPKPKPKSDGGYRKKVEPKPEKPVEQEKPATKISNGWQPTSLVDDTSDTLDF